MGQPQKRVLVIGRDNSAAQALRDVLASDACCDLIEESSEVDDRIATGDYALIVLDARPPESAEPVIESVRRIPRSRRPLLFVLADDAQRLPQRLDPRIVTLLIRRPLNHAAVRAALEQTIRRILAVGGEDTLRRLREAGATAPRSGTVEGGVLVVDDDKAIRELMAAVFRREGLDTDVAADGDVAIEQLRKKRYRVLLLDLMMPRLSGWEVIGWLRSNPEFRPRTVIISTAADRNAFTAIDPDVVNAVFVKPFDVAEVGGYVRACSNLPLPSDRRKRRVIGQM